MYYTCNTLSDCAAMKSLATLSLLFLLPSIHAAALPHLIGSELESTSSSLKREASGKLVPRSPHPAASMTDDPSLDPSSKVMKDLSARSPQGPASNPGEFTDVGLSRYNPANRHAYSSSAGAGQDMYTVTVEADPGKESMMVEGAKIGNHTHYNSSHNHKANSTIPGHRNDSILTEFNAHGEHFVVYNGTHYPNGTSYSPANKTANGGVILGDVIVAGDEVVVYSQPRNETRHHRHHHNQTEGDMPTATGFWLPSGTGWIPSGKGRPRNQRKVPRPGYAGFRGPKVKQ